MGGVRYGETPLSVAPSYWGVYGEYMYLHPNSVLHKVPSHIPAKEAVLAFPLGNGIEWAIVEGNIGIGKTIVIQGPGQQGLACTHAAKVAGADCIIVTGLSKDKQRMELACKLGADHTISVDQEDLVSRISDITGGEMADVVIDVASGGTATVKHSPEITKKRGTIILVGQKKQLIDEFNADTLIIKYLTVKGVRGHSYDSVEKAIEMMASRKYAFGELSTHHFHLPQVHDALMTVVGKEIRTPYT